jgi:hypothetical protein
VLAVVEPHEAAALGLAGLVGQQDAEEVVAALDDVAVARVHRALERREHGRPELGAHELVGVEPQDPVVRRGSRARVALARVAEPLLLHDAGAARARELERAVRAPGVDDDHLVGEGQRPDAPFDVPLLVLAEDER